MPKEGWGAHKGRQLPLKNKMATPTLVLLHQIPSMYYAIFYGFTYKNVEIGTDRKFFGNA